MQCSKLQYIIQYISIPYHRKRRKEGARKRASFLANPFKLTKQLLGQKRTGGLTCSKEVMNNHLKATYSENNR